MMMMMMMMMMIGISFTYALIVWLCKESDYTQASPGDVRDPIPANDSGCVGESPRHMHI